MYIDSCFLDTSNEDFTAYPFGPVHGGDKLGSYPLLSSRRLVINTSAAAEPQCNAAGLEP